MRVTNRMLTESVINTINTNFSRLGKYQKQLASGERINRPSDDPVATARLLAAKSELKAQEQYRQNMQDAVGWLETTDGALELAGDVLQRVRELAVYGSNGTLPEQSMVALSNEVNELIEEMVGIGNTNYAGRYIFGGSKTTAPPFKITGRDNNSINEVQFIDESFNESLLDKTYSLQFEVETGVVMDIAGGGLTFHTNAGGSPEVNVVFNVMIGLRQSLEAGNKNEVGASIGKIDKLIDNILSERAITGAKSKRLTSLQERSSTYELHLNTLIGRLGYVEYEEAAINYSAQETVYQAALATGAKVIQPSLIDFLK